MFNEKNGTGQSLTNQHQQSANTGSGMARTEANTDSPPNSTVEAWWGCECALPEGFIASLQPAP